jgi:hypothetical protein
MAMRIMLPRTPRDEGDSNVLQVNRIRANRCLEVSGRRNPKVTTWTADVPLCDR